MSARVSSFVLSSFSIFSLQTEEDGKKATESAIDLWNEKPITTKDRWYLSPGEANITVYLTYYMPR